MSLVARKAIGENEILGSGQIVGQPEVVRKGFAQSNGRTCAVRSGEALRIGLVRGATRVTPRNHVRLEANASAQLDLPVASWFLLRRTSS